jgi:hypothetical protein
MILVDLEDLAAHVRGHGAQLALLIGRGLIESADPKVKGGSAHGVPR